MSRYVNIPPISTGDSWVTASKYLLQSGAPALTTFQEVKPGMNEFGATLAGAASNDGLKVGGAVGNAASAYKVFTNSVFQTPKTTSWGVVFRASMPTPASGKFNSVGLINGAGTNAVSLASYFGQSAVNYVLDINTGAAETIAVSATAVTAAVRDYALTFDGTTIKTWVDGLVTTGTTTTLTNLADEPMFLAIFGTDALAVKGCRILYGYIAP